MTVRTRRGLTRVGVGVAALLVGAGAFATPALAAGPADIAVGLTGTTLSVGSTVKDGSMSIKNNGPGDAADIAITFDIRELDADLVKFPLTDVCGESLPGRISCELVDNPVLTNGTDTDLPIPLERVKGTGPAGKLTVTIAHGDEDPNLGNNTVTVDVVIEGEGVDLTVIAPDVYQPETEDTPLAPGGAGQVDVLVWNFGDKTADGVLIEITLPEHVVFTEPEPDCTHAAGDRTTTCKYVDTLLVPPAEVDEAADLTNFAGFFFRVKVADDAPTPAALTGQATAGAIEELADPTPPVLARKAAPRNLITEVPAEFKDVDPSDNTDDFVVFVAVAGGGGGGGLPITGTNVTIIGGVGLAVLVLGAVLFVVARRRRVVLAPPTE